jgi:3-phosphoshikimate 1-carboxyvinyltransferase
MGVEINNDPLDNTVIIKGNGLHGLQKPETTLDAGNSGTTVRLMSGILSGQKFSCEITGDESIRKRPMNRVISPLTLMGANIKSLTDNGLAPLIIEGNTGLKAIHYNSPVASAQVKSAILLAGLYADGITTVTEPYISRNHTEVMLKNYGAVVKTVDNTAIIEPNPVLLGTDVLVPGDISSTAYFIAAGLLVPGSEILLKNVGINPTRDGILKVAELMGANLEITNIRNAETEAIADIIVRSCTLKGAVINGSLIPTLIDELPIIAVMACFAEGTTVIADASELKVKESNRIDVMVHNLTNMGADVIATDDGMIIHGGKPLKGVVIDSKADHRIAMSFAIAGLLSDGDVIIQGKNCVEISYPTFFEDLDRLTR